MILSKCDMRIAAMYDAQLADTEEEKALGVVLRGKFDDTVKAVLEVMHALSACAYDACVCDFDAVQAAVKMPHHVCHVALLL